MKLKDLFKQNPFQNLIVAGQSAAEFPLRGHEVQLELRLREIGDAIENPEYPANAQHTLVFGEWGHGKTHLLRTIEYKINKDYSQRAKAVFFEPTKSDPQAIFEELCIKLEIRAGNSIEFIKEVQKNFKENLFLLIDETQAVLGEKLSVDFEDNLRAYWNLLSELQSSASDRLYGLHIFHGLSANSAAAIHQIGQIPVIQQFNRHLFSLKSLDEESQWRMLCDHIEIALKDDVIEPESLINRGVSRCINELTGGNPRFVLSLMRQIFSKAQSKNSNTIDGLTCYETLCETQRLDASGQNYFNRPLIKEILDQLKIGHQFEQKIYEMLKQKIGFILGEWSGINQEFLAQYSLTTANIRRPCISLTEPIVLFDQPPGQTQLRLSYDFLRLIQVTPRKTLTNTDDKDELLRLTLDPQALLPRMITGIQQVMSYNGFHGQFKPLSTASPFRIYITNLGSSQLAYNIKVGIAVFKGKEISQEVFEKLTAEIEADHCTVMIVIEDANTRHDSPGSGYDKFKSIYSGWIDVGKRFVFINGTDLNGQEFDEDFFIKLIKIRIGEDEAKEWFDRLQIDKKLKAIQDECIYCPDFTEQTLLEETFRHNRSFKIREIKDLSDTFSWVNRERLARLDLYLQKTGTSYTSPNIDQIFPFKFILSKLQKSTEGLAKSEIEGLLTAKYIRTGLTAAVSSYIDWVIKLLLQHNRAYEENQRVFFKDLDRELIQLKDRYSQILVSIQKDISIYEAAQIELPELKDITSKQNEICQRLSEIVLDSTIELEILEYNDSLDKLDDLKSILNGIPEKAQLLLRSQFRETYQFFKGVREDTSWPFDDMINPYEAIYHLNEISGLLDKLDNQIQEEIPHQRYCRQEIRAINKRLSGLDSLLKGDIASGSYEKEEVFGCIFKIFNAIKGGKSGEITLYCISE
ncbi:MAG: AAA family ATPase [Planctomycetes bacterium]|nr:AAA family ATPase [Planctomycetota bacterium]